MRRIFAALVLSFGVITSAVAGADVPPGDSCSKVGEACNTAGSNFNEPGVCRVRKCSRPSPNGPMEYDCERCVADAAGAGGSPASGGSGTESGGSSAATGGTPAAAGSSESSATKSDDGGCSVNGRGAGSVVPLGVLALAVLSLRRARRR